MYSNCAITSFKHLFSRIFEIFNEMEMEIHKITKLYLKTIVREKDIS